MEFYRKVEQSPRSPQVFVDFGTTREQELDERIDQTVLSVLIS